MNIRDFAKVFHLPLEITLICGHLSILLGSFGFPLGSFGFPLGFLWVPLGSLGWVILFQFSHKEHIMTQTVFLEHIWDYLWRILSASCVFFYFMKKLKNVCSYDFSEHHITETQKYFSYRSNFGCYITQHFNCISWIYEILSKSSICHKKLPYFVLIWASFGFPLGSFGFLWVIRRTPLFQKQTS